MAKKKPTVIAFIARPGAGKTTLVRQFRKRHTSFRHFDVYTFVAPYRRRNKPLPEGALERSYKEFARQVHSARGDIILEFGISHPTLSLETIAQFKRNANVYAFYLVRNVGECFRFKKKQRGGMYHTESLRIRMRNAFPKHHKALAGKLNIPFSKLEMWRGYENVLRSVERFSMQKVN